MISKSEEKTTDDLRKVEYNMLVLPTQLETGEYVDVRLALPSGQDYIVVSKKQVEIPQINGIDSDDTVELDMLEKMYSAAKRTNAQYVVAGYYMEYYQQGKFSPHGDGQIQ